MFKIIFMCFNNKHKIYTFSTENIKPREGKKKKAIVFIIINYNKLS